MGLRMIIGRAGSGKTTLCLREIAAKQKTEEKSSLIYIVPEQYSLQAEKELIQETGGKGLLQAQVITFGRLAYRVFQEIGAGHKTTLSEIGKKMVLEKILIDERENLEYFQQAVLKNGFMDQLNQSISELFQYHVSGEQLGMVLEAIPEDSVIRPKLKDLLLVYIRYLEFIDKGYLPGEEALDILAAQAQRASFLDQALVWIDGFYGFTPQELRVIVELMKKCRQVTVSLPIDETVFHASYVPLSNLFFEPYDTWRQLKNAAENASIPIEKTVVCQRQFRFGSQDMAVLERNFDSFYPSGEKCQGDIKLFGAINRYQEVSYIAASILRLVKEEGLRFRDIAVMTKDIEGYEKDFASIFQEFQIPFFLDRKINILSHPLIDLVRGLLSMIAYHLDYESVFRYLKTGLANLAFDEVDILENYVLAYGIKSYQWFYDTWERGLEEEQKEILNYLKEQFLDPIKEFYKSASSKKEKTVKELTLLVYDVLQKLEVEEKIENKIQEFLIQGSQEEAYIWKQTWDMLITILENLVDILGQEEVTVQEYLSLFEQGAESGKLGLIPTKADCIIIGDVERSRLPKIQALFVAGVNDGILPSVPQINGVFSERERMVLEEERLPMAHNGRRKVFEEQFLIYCGMTKPQRKLYFTYALGDYSGKPMLPSSLIGKLKIIFSNLEEEPEEDLEEMLSYFPWVALHRLGQTLRQQAEGEKVPDQWKAIYQFLSTDEKWKEKTTDLLKALSDTNRAPYLAYETTKKLYPGKLYSSVSRLEKFVSCPFSYFVQYSLQAKERKIYQIETPDLGFLFHGVLEQFSKQVQEEGKSWRELTEQEVEEKIERAVEEKAPEIGNEVLYSTAAHQYLLKRLKRTSKRAVCSLLEHVRKGSFEPFDFEIGFGEGQKLPGIAILLPSGETMILNGKIDRVDILDQDGRKYVKILDYKSGTKSFRLRDIYYGMQLQLLLYMEAFLETGEKILKGPLFPGGIFYFHITDPMIQANSHMSAEEIETLLLKELKLSGLVLKDSTVIQGLDHSFGEPGATLEKISSDIIPVAVSTKGELKASSSVADLEQYGLFMSYAKKKAGQIGEEIRKGNIMVSPCQDGQSVPCSYCKFRGICRFDETNGDTYRVWKKISAEKIWENMRK